MGRELKTAAQTAAMKQQAAQLRELGETFPNWKHEPCGQWFTKYAGGFDSLLDHPCKAITPYALLHPEWDALAKRVRRDLEAWREQN